MKVNLVGMTKPSAYTGCSTANELVAYTARVSNPTNQNNTATAGTLVKYLVKNKHFSPLEMVHITFEIVTTRDIARQMLRHRSFSFQEFSGRYAEQTSFVTDREVRLQDTKNRQNSIYVEDTNLQEYWNMAQKDVELLTKGIYNAALKKGIAKEVARSILPEGLTESTLYMSGTLRSWLHYCQLRTANGTQKEHMEIAAKCWEIIKGHFPDVDAAIQELAAEV